MFSLSIFNQRSSLADASEYLPTSAGLGHGYLVMPLADSKYMAYLDPEPSSFTGNEPRTINERATV